MRVIKNILVLFVLTQSLSNIAQIVDTSDPSKFKPNIPTSPEIATLGKFGDVPVGLYTGVPNITIPLYSLKIKGFELPISMSYNSSGIKVEELATNTGLGWALNAGGAISCSVNGLPDFGSRGYATPASAADSLPSTHIGDLTFGFDYSDLSGLGGNGYQFATAVVNGELDSQPDLYYYSFVNKSGKFYTDQHRQLHTMPFMPIKITHDLATNTFKITDEQGVVYSFAAFDTSIMGNNCGTPIVNASILLTKIQLPDGNTISFTYTPITYAYNIQPSVVRKIPMPGNYAPNLFDCSNYGNNTINMSGSRLSEITSTLGHDIKFIYHNNRTDLPGTQSLDSVIIKNQNKVINAYAFNYGYFNNGSGGPDNYRLKLLSIVNQNSAKHTFTYNESITLPARLSFAQDHWGYYNGKSSNTTLFPLDYEHSFSDGADREVDSTFSQMCMLKQITYPTGGYTKFNYEQNDYYYTGYDKTYITTSYNAYGQDNQNITTSFSIPAGTSIISSTVKFDDGSGFTTGGGLGNEPVDPATTITLSGDNGFFQTFYNGMSPNGMIGATLTPGNYTISVNNQSTVNGAYCTVSVITSTSQYVEKNKLLGGLRIKNIVSKSSASSNDEYIQYVYRQESYPLRSSGNVNFLPQYTYTSHRFFYNKPDPTNPNQLAQCIQCYQTPHFVDYYQQSTNSVYPIGAIKGGSVGYSFVTTLYGSTAQNGKTESTFNFMADYGAGVISPVVPVVVNDWKSGFLIKEVQYRNRNGLFQPLMLTQNTYSIQSELLFWNKFYDPATYNNDSYFRGLGVSIEYVRDERICGLTKYVAQFRANAFRYDSEWVRQDSTSTTNYSYDNSGTLAGTLVTHKYFTYSNPAHMLPSITTTKNSKGNTIQMSQNYPQDYATGTSVALDSLVAQHRISTPIRSEVNNNASVQATNTIYRVWSNSIVEPEYVQSQHNNLGFENRIQFYGYDNKANALAGSQSSGPPFAYHWGYNQEYPIAECKNATNDEFYTQNFEEYSGSTSGTSHTGIRYYSGTFSTSDKLSASYHGRSYLISYWYKSGGGQWVYSGEVTYIGQTLSGDLDDVRIYPKDSQVTTYTYEPLVGITSAIDTKGLTIYYEYDAFQRLMNIKDKDGNIVKHTDYHYQQ